MTEGFDEEHPEYAGIPCEQCGAAFEEHDAKATGPGYGGLSGYAHLWREPGFAARLAAEMKRQGR